MNGDVIYFFKQNLQFSLEIKIKLNHSVGYVYLILLRQYSLHYITLILKQLQKTSAIHKAHKST